MIQICRFCFFFLFIIYLLSVIANLTITLTFVDSLLNSYVLLSLQFLSFRSLSSTTVCIPKYLYTLETGDNTVTYNPCATQLFFVITLGVAELFSPDVHVLCSLCGHLQTPALHNHYERHCLH